MSEAAKHIHIRRDRGFYGVLRKLKINVDGAELLRIKSGETHDIKLPPNARALTLQMDWITTDPFDLTDVLPNDTLVIHVLKRSFEQMRGGKELPFAIRLERS